MKSLRSLFQRFAALFSRKRADLDLDAEMQSHLAMHVDDNLRAGMTPEQARRQALMKLGGLEQTKELYRERRSLPFFDTSLKDLRYALRTLRKTPEFTLVAVLTLALGIAVNATMFSLLSAFLLRRPPGRDPERVAVVTSVTSAAAYHPDAFRVSAPNYLAWRKADQVFDEMAAADNFRSVNLVTRTQPESRPAAAVSPEYFHVLGVVPQLGRTFTDDEAKSGHDHVVILSHALWETRFASDSNILARTIRINRSDYAVVGVMPASFQLLGYTPQLWIPLVLDGAEQNAAARADRSLHIFGRLKPGASIEQARAEFVSFARRAELDFPETDKGWGAAVRSLPDFLVYDFGIRTAMVIVMTTVGVVLLIACANVAGLLLARAAYRSKELAIRIALGASRMRIVRQSLTEVLVISLLGGAVGLFLARWGVVLLRANFNFNEAASAVPISLDWNVVLFATGASFLSTLLCGLAPALNASRMDAGLVEESRGASASLSRSRLRSVFVIAEIALALFLLTGSGLLILGLFLIEHQNLGFQPDHLLTADVFLDESRYSRPADRVLFVQDALRRLHQISGAQAAAAASDLPATGATRVTLQIKGQPDLPGNQRPSTLHSVITPDYFLAAGIPSQRGRTFTERDNASAPRVIVVNQEFVHRFFGDQDPLGKQIRLDLPGDAPEWEEIVGVVANVTAYSESIRVDPVVFECFLQRPLQAFSLMVRTSGAPNTFASSLREAIAQLDPELPLAHVMSMPGVIELQKNGDTVFMRILGTFALLALILAAIGLYGLVTYSVNQRAREIGIRMALGAGGTQVLAMILRQGLKISLVGVAIGTILALPLPKLFDSVFFDLHLREPRIFVIVPGALLAVAMLATYLPARRATRIDPIRALRQD